MLLIKLSLRPKPYYPVQIAYPFLGFDTFSPIVFRPSKRQNNFLGESLLKKSVRLIRDASCNNKIQEKELLSFILVPIKCKLVYDAVRN